MTHCTLGVGCDETGTCYALAHDAPEQCGRPPEPWDHNYRRIGSAGMCIFYECTKCGDDYEKDVS